MNFSELYNNNRTAVERALVAMWCGESNNDSQRSYIKQMKTLIGNLFAPENAVLCLSNTSQHLYWCSYGEYLKFHSLPTKALASSVFSGATGIYEFMH